MEIWATNPALKSFFLSSATVYIQLLHNVLKGIFFSVSPPFCLFILVFIWCAFFFFMCTIPSFSWRVACSSRCMLLNCYHLIIFIHLHDLVSDLLCWRLCYFKLNFRKVDFFVYYRTIFAKLMLYSTIKAILYFRVCLLLVYVFAHTFYKIKKIIATSRNKKWH